MALLEFKCSSKLLLSLNDTVLINNLVDNTNITFQIPKYLKSKEENNQHICMIAFSEACEFLAIITDKKVLLIYSEINVTYNCTHTHYIPRAASAIRFSKNSNKLVIADKSGDVYIAEENNGWLPNLVLGHLSMLLDVLITPDDKCIISCDRDEKIRVTSFPDTFNVVAYCLGHEEFVSSIDILNEYPDILFSASGDATFRAWHYPTGQQLLCAKLSDAIVGMKVTLADKNIIAITSLYNSHDVNICAISFTEENSLECKLVQTIKLTAIASDFAICKKSLWFLDNNCLMEYIFDMNSLLYVKNNERPACIAANELLSQNKNSNKGDFVASLFKKQYNNIEEYHKKKKLRINKDLSNDKE